MLFVSAVPPRRSSTKHENITGVHVRELGPDRVLDAAEEVELTDMAPHAPRQRMKLGNIYPPERAEGGAWRTIGYLMLRDAMLDADRDALREAALLQPRPALTRRGSKASRSASAR